MGVTNYATMNGVLVGETGPNGTQYYHTDALGSVTMTTDAHSNVLNTYRYKPYGAQLSKTGTAPDPKFTWVGTRGYRTTGLSHSEYYVRARHYGENESQWTAVDPIWPVQERYIYTRSPATLFDPSGKLVGDTCGASASCAGYVFSGYLSMRCCCCEFGETKCYYCECHVALFKKWWPKRSDCTLLKVCFYMPPAQVCSGVALASTTHVS